MVVRIGMEDAKGAIFPNPTLWMIAIAMLFVDVAWLAFSDISIMPMWAVAKSAFITIAFLSAAILCRYFNFKKLSILFFTLAFFMAFGKSARVLNHLSASMGFPFIDHFLSKMDNSLGLDWFGYAKYINDHEMLRIMLWFGYNIHEILFTVIIAFLIVKSDFKRIHEFLVIFVITVLVTLVFGALFPALGTYAYYNPGSEIIGNFPPDAGRYFVKHLYTLNTGTLKTIDFTYMPGLVSMPSYHTIMALMIIYTTRGTIMQPILLIPALLMLAGTPVYGGHYLFRGHAWRRGNLLLRGVVAQQDGRNPGWRATKRNPRHGHESARLNHSQIDWREGPFKILGALSLHKRPLDDLCPLQDRARSRSLKGASFVLSMTVEPCITTFKA